MSFEVILKEHIQNHPAMQPQDVVKLCYQAAHGPEHMIVDPELARAHLKKEMTQVTPEDMRLCERISSHYVRVNLAAWKYRELPEEWLFKLFCMTAEEKTANNCSIESCLAVVEDHLDELSFSRELWHTYISAYREKGMPAVHHSEQYRKSEKPAYRVINDRCLRIVPILEAIKACRHRPCVIAIDGRAASGKTTMSAHLSRVLDLEAVRMDDFFLPTELRTEERLSSAGGNVHYERFQTEVLPYLRTGAAFSYRVFSCCEMDYAGSREIKSGEYRVVEGSYSLHPEFGNYADIKVLSCVDSQEQMRRIVQRNGAQKAEIFKNRWIPMEETYFESFHIKDQCDLLI